MKIKNLATICVFCIASCSPKDTKDTSDASNRDELKLEQTGAEIANNPKSEKQVAEGLKPPSSEETKLNFSKEAAEEIERKAVAGAKMSEERIASARAARAKLIGTQLDSLQLANKKIYKEVMIRNITDVEVSISHESGMATIRIKELTPQDQKRFHFDKQVAEEIVKAQSIQAAEIASRPSAPQSGAVTSEKQAEAAARRATLLREEIAKEENKLVEMKASLVRLKTEHQNVIDDINEETSNAQRIKNTRYDGIGGNERIGGINTSKADRQTKVNTAAARVSSGEVMIRQVEARIRSLKSQL